MQCLLPSSRGADLPCSSRPASKEAPKITNRNIFYQQCHHNVRMSTRLGRVGLRPRTTIISQSGSTVTESELRAKAKELKELINRLKSVNSDVRRSIEEIEGEVPITDLPKTLATLKSGKSGSTSTSSTATLTPTLTTTTTTTTQQRTAAQPLGTTSVPVAPAKKSEPSVDAEIVPMRGPANFTSDSRQVLFDVPLPPLPLPGGAPGQPGGQPRKAVVKTTEPQDIVFVTAEAAPWSKTGGLGDVMGSLPIELAERGHRVMVVVPRYLSDSTKKRYEGLKDLNTPTRIDLGRGGQHTVNFFHKHEHGVDFVFVDHISFHREGTPYGSGAGPFSDNLFRFSLLSMAACEAPLVLNIGGYHHGTPPGLPYGQKVLFVANDWHTGLVPVYVASKYRKHGVYKDARCVLAIHNLAHQGAYPPACFDALGVPGDWYGAMDFVDEATRVKTINVLKAALVTSDHIFTVSQAYAWEIALGDQGMGLGGLLKQRMKELTGIVNGIDVREWDPQTDPYLKRNYSAGDLSGKAACKEALQEELGLPADPAAPLIGFIGRLDYQKGPDLVLSALEQLVDMGCQVVMLGSGAPDYEELVKRSQEVYRYNVRGYVGFSVPLSHKILAGADILLMPSRFEPCGLNQMYAMRYGTVPVAHSTGGLRDTIDDVNPFRSDLDTQKSAAAANAAKSKGNGRFSSSRLAGAAATPVESEVVDVGTGWTFTPATLPAMMDALTAAIDIFENKPAYWRRIMATGMAKDFSWTRAAGQYEKVLTKVAANTAYCK